MQESQRDKSPENQPAEKGDRTSTPKSSFNDAEYERWSEKLRNAGRSKDK